MRERSARRLLGLGVPIATLVSGFAPFLAWRSQLPARVASHFGFSGAPDGSMTVAGFALTMSVMLVPGIAACLALALSRRPLHGVVAPLMGFLGSFMSSLAAGILAWTAMTQRGLASWQDAAAPGWSFVGLIAASIAVGAGGAYLGSQLPSVPSNARPPHATAPMPLADGERAVWNSSIQNKWFLGLGLLSVIAGVMTALFAHWAFAMAPLIVGMVILAVSSVTARVDRDGLHVAYGLFPWPTTTITTNQIASASAIDVRPMEWGGWGYRGSLTLMKQAAVVLRAGPGLRLDLDDGKVFVVTVDDPATPAALLNAEVIRSRG